MVPNIEGLCRKHETRLVRYLTGMLRSPESAREVAQDTFERIHQTYRLEEVLFPRAMLFKVATNFALMRLRREHLERTLFTEGTDADELVPDADPEPERQLLNEQLRESVMSALDSLVPTQRAVVVMAHIQGKSRSEIAAALGISERRVDKRMTRGLRSCRKRLEARGIDLAQLY
jgi:RNA polymerase sigma factor (sigma-70 family)